MKMMARLALTLALLVPMPAAAAETVYVIRHMQKAQGDDPALTAEGAANARTLADLLAAKGITAIYATTFNRTQQTGAPLAARLGLAVTPYDPRNPAAMVAAAGAAKGAVLVIGHSNTVPELVERFGGERPADIPETDYGSLFVVRSGSAKVERIEIGTPR